MSAPAHSHAVHRGWPEALHTGDLVLAQIEPWTPEPPALGGHSRQSEPNQNLRPPCDSLRAVWSGSSHSCGGVLSGELIHDSLRSQEAAGCGPIRHRSHWADDATARLLQEGQGGLASLNHPNIAAIYGIEQSDDTRALVLELVEGPTLG